MRALEPWVAGPLQTFIDESSARLILLMTMSGQVVAQHGFTRSRLCAEEKRSPGRAVRHAERGPLLK